MAGKIPTLVKWSQECFTLKEFAEYYRHEVPLLVKVTQGYCGIDESKYTFCMEDVYHISHINSQTRIVTKDSTGRMLSIPEDYPVKFHRTGRGSAPRRFLEMFEKEPFVPGIKVTPADNTKLSFFIGADRKMKTGIETLQLVDSYKDYYLVGNSIINGQIYEPSVDIPLFIGIKVSVAEGLKIGFTEDFTKIMAQYKAETINFNNQTVPGNPEIMLYESEEQGGGAEYAYLEPKTYISCAELAALKGAYTALKPTPTKPSTPDGKSDENLYTDVSENQEKNSLRPQSSLTKPRTAPKPKFVEAAGGHTPETTSFKSLEDIPKDLSGLGIHHVADCLRLISMARYCEQFLEQDIDGSLLVALDKHMLMQDLGMTKLDATKLHLFIHENWRPKKN